MINKRMLFALEHFNKSSGLLMELTKIVVSKHIDIRTTFVLHYRCEGKRYKEIIEVQEYPSGALKAFYGEVYA